MNKNSFVFMKIGPSTGETLEAIIQRKRQEIKECGECFWGYGGKICHPLTQVRPFAEQAVEEHGEIYLFMQKTTSDFDSEIHSTTEYSEDGQTFKSISAGIRVSGSSFALVLDSFEAADFEIPFDSYIVGIGNSKGTPATEYVKNRIDKACLVLDGGRTNSEQNMKKIDFIAKLKSPYAVFVR